MSKPAAQIAQPSAVLAPPPPHDPADRCWLRRVGDWEIRVHALNDPRHAYLTARGLLHLQLWHPGVGASVLTPSQLTERAYELWGPEHRRFCCYRHLARFLREELALAVPCPRMIRHLELWFVHARTIGAVSRSPPA